MNYKNLLSPPAQEAQIVWSFKEKFYPNGNLDGIYPFPCIFDESEELEPNPTFWFSSEEDCQTFLKNATLEEILELLEKETYYK